MASFMPGPLTEEKRPQYSLNREAGGSKSRSLLFGEDIKLLHLTGIQPQFLGCLAYRLVTT